MLTYHINRNQDGSITVIETGTDGSRPVDPHQADYLSWLSQGNVPEVVIIAQPDPPPGPTLARAKSAKQAEIKAGADAILLPLVTEYPECEVRTWEQQATEAAALQVDPNAAAPLVRGMAQERGVDVLYLAGRILFHVAEWKAVSGPVIGQRQKFQDHLDAITEDTPENAAAVQALVVNYNLPL